MSDLQRNHLNLDLIKNVEDNVVLLTRKVFFFCEFLHRYMQQEMRKSLLPQMKININIDIYLYLIRQSF